MSVYTAENVKDLDITTPTENSTPPSEVNNSDREIKDVVKNQWATIVKSTAYTLTPQDSLVLVSGTTTITIPASTDVSSSTFFKKYTIIKTDAAGTNVTIARTGSDTFNGATSITLTKQYEGAIIFGSGVADWKFLRIDPEITVSDTVTNITGDTTITAAQMTGRVRFYNSAQTAITLPAATAGLTSIFEIVHSGGVRFIRNGTNTFTCGGVSSLTALPVGGTAYDTVVGGLYDLTCYVNGTWVVKRLGVQPKFEAYMGATQVITTGNTAAVEYNTEELDNMGEYNTSTYIHTPTVPGRYRYDGNIYFTIASGGGVTILKAVKNGATFKGHRDRTDATSGGNTISVSSDMNGTDTMKIQTTNAIGDSITLQASQEECYFRGERMSD